jgi:hypothetical protein
MAAMAEQVPRHTFVEEVDPLRLQVAVDGVLWLCNARQVLPVQDRLFLRADSFGWIAKAFTVSPYLGDRLLYRRMLISAGSGDEEGKTYITTDLGRRHDEPGPRQVYLGKDVAMAEVAGYEIRDYSGCNENMLLEEHERWIRATPGSHPPAVDPYVVYQWLARHARQLRSVAEVL